MDQKFFLVPFANGGDKTAVPNPVQPSGEVSYTTGWGFDYQRVLGTDPAAKPVGRQPMNQLGYDITQALGALQRKAFPEFITTANNDGAPFPYSSGTVVMFFDAGVFRPWVSLVDANTAIPNTDPTKWQPLLYAESSNAQAVAGTDGTTVMTPRRVAAAIAALGATIPDATTVVSGKTRYATTAETNAITVANAAVTPSALGNFAQKTGAQITGLYQWRSRNLVQWFDANNDVACVEIGGGVSTTSDRKGYLINRNATGGIEIWAGNGGCQLSLTPSAWTFSAGGTVSGILNVTGGIACGAGITFGENLQSSTANVVIGPNSSGAGNIYFRPNGIGTTSSQMVLNPTSGNLNIAGTCFATAFQVGSSEKIKDIEGPITGALDIVARMSAVWGAYKASYRPDGRRRAFLIAENLLDGVLPEAVTENAVRSIQGDEESELVPTVDYDQTVPVLVAALNEERCAREACEARLAEIEARLAALGV